MFVLLLWSFVFGSSSLFPSPSFFNLFSSLSLSLSLSQSFSLNLLSSLIFHHSLSASLPLSLLTFLLHQSPSSLPPSLHHSSLPPVLSLHSSYLSPYSPPWILLSSILPSYLSLICILHLSLLVPLPPSFLIHRPLPLPLCWWFHSTYLLVLGIAKGTIEALWARKLASRIILCELGTHHPPLPFFFLPFFTPAILFFFFPRCFFIFFLFW